MVTNSGRTDSTATTTSASNHNSHRPTTNKVNSASTDRVSLSTAPSKASIKYSSDRLRSDTSSPTSSRRSEIKDTLRSKGDRARVNKEDRTRHSNRPTRNGSHHSHRVSRPPRHSNSPGNNNTSSNSRSTRRDSLRARVDSRHSRPSRKQALDPAGRDSRAGSSNSVNDDQRPRNNSSPEHNTSRASERHRAIHRQTQAVSRSHDTNRTARSTDAHSPSLPALEFSVARQGLKRRELGDRNRPTRRMGRGTVRRQTSKARAKSATSRRRSGTRRRDSSSHRTSSELTGAPASTSLHMQAVSFRESRETGRTVLCLNSRRHAPSKPYRWASRP